MAVEVIPYLPATTGKILDLIVQDGQHWGIHACQTFPVGYNLPTGTDPPPDTIQALTSAAVLSTGFLNGRTTLDPTVGNWVVITVPSTGGLWATPLEELAQLPTLVSHPYYAILAWVERGVVRPWQWSMTSPLPPPTAKGNILRANTDANGVLYWEQYPLSAGQQGMVLTDDVANSGLPIWAQGGPQAPAISTVANPSVTVQLSNAGGAIVCQVVVLGGATTALPGGDACVYNLWNGSANSAPPAGWYLYGAAENLFTRPPAQAITDQGGTPSGWWSSPTAAAPSQQVLLRQHFPLPPGTITAATLYYSPGSTGLEGYVNGNAIGGFHSATTPYAVAPGLFLPGQDNVLATRSGTYGNNPAFAWIGFTITLTYA